MAGSKAIKDKAFRPVIAGQAINYTKKKKSPKKRPGY